MLNVKGHVTGSEGEIMHFNRKTPDVECKIRDFKGKMMGFKGKIVGLERKMMGFKGENILFKENSEKSDAF